MIVNVVASLILLVCILFITVASTSVWEWAGAVFLSIVCIGTASSVVKRHLDRNFRY